jgi:hypothetical protein
MGYAYVEQLADGQRQHTGDGFGTLSRVGAPSSPRLPKWVPKKFLEQEREAMGDEAQEVKQAEDEQDLIQRYLVATCYLGHGHFEQITDTQILTDVSLIVAQKRLTIGSFAMAIRAAHEAAGDGRAE